MSLVDTKYVDDIAAIVREARIVIADAEGHNVDTLTLGAAERLVGKINLLIETDKAALGSDYKSRSTR